MKFPHPFKGVGDCICPIRMQTTCAWKKGELFLKRKFTAFEGQGWKGNRLSYHLNVSPLTRTPNSPNNYVLHDCGNDWCINPGHLYLGTIAQNSVDMYRHRSDIKTQMSASQKRAWQTPERRDIQRKKLIGNKNALGKKWKLGAQTIERMREGWTDERRAAQALRMAKLNRARTK